MRVLSVTWSDARDLTKIKFSDEFLSSDSLVRADILYDLVCELSAKYDQTVIEMVTPIQPAEGNKEQG
jgi:hypothetical protein